MLKPRSLAAFAGGVAIAIAFGVWAQAGYPTRPRFNAVGIGTTPPAGNSQLTIAGANPISWLQETDQAANAQWWATPTVNGGVLQLMGCTSFGSGCASFLNATRSAGTITNLDLLATAITLNGVASSDFARLSQSQTFTANQVLQTATTPSLTTRTTSTDANHYASMLTQIDSAGTPTSTYHFTANNGSTSGFGCSAVECGGIWNTAAQTVLTANSNSDVLSVSSNAVSFDGVDWTPSSGAFTATYTNCCTTSPTQSIRWFKVGNLVTMTAAAAMATSTADTTIFDTDLDVPAAIRPVTSNAYSAGFGANNNGTSVTAMIEIATNGEIIVNRCGAVTGTCDGGAWSGTGNRALDAWTLSYVIQ